MNDPIPSEFYCSNTIRLASNAVLYPKSISPWSPFAPKALEAIQGAVKQVSTMTADELRQLVGCILNEYLDLRSASAIADGIPQRVLEAVLETLRPPAEMPPQEKP